MRISSLRQAGRVALFIAASALGVCPTSSEAQPLGVLTVAIGRTNASTASSAYAGAFRLELMRALGEHQSLIMTARQRARYVVDASLVGLSHERGDDGPALMCEVTLFVTDSDTGAIQAILSGRGGVRTEQSGPRVAQTALEAAVRSAVRPLGDALRRVASAK